MNYKTLQLVFDSALATITFNRPEKRNAMGLAFWADLPAAMAALRADAGAYSLTGPFLGTGKLPKSFSVFCFLNQSAVLAGFSKIFDPR